MYRRLSFFVRNLVYGAVGNYSKSIVWRQPSSTNLSSWRCNTQRIQENPITKTSFEYNPSVTSCEKRSIAIDFVTCSDSRYASSRRARNSSSSSGMPTLTFSDFPALWVTGQEFLSQIIVSFHFFWVVARTRIRPTQKTAEIWSVNSDQGLCSKTLIFKENYSWQKIF